MTQLLRHPLYQEDLEGILHTPIHWEKLSHASVLISGATGMIGGLLIDTLMKLNQEKNLDCSIYALGRSRDKAEKRLGTYFENPLFHFAEGDINQGISLEVPDVDYILHAASNTHPRQYSADPVGTITTNIIGTDNLLKFGRDHHTKRFIFLSSVEIYGENRGDTERFREDYLGYLDCNTMRAGYPESKRCGEALCQAYRAQYGMDVVIPRLSRVYGPSMQLTDSKAIAQFIRNGAEGKDIVLKSEGTQLYSYTYAADAVAAILTIFSEGKDGECYNVSDPSSDITLKELAKIIADAAGTHVVFDLPDAAERAGYSKATKALLDPSKLIHLGFSARYGIREGLNRTIRILKDVYYES